MTALQKAQNVLQLIAYRQDAVDKMVQTVSEAYGADEHLDETQYADKQETLKVLTEVCEETIDPVLTEVAKAYAVHYTSEELSLLIEWYSSPLGQKVLAESSSLLVDVTNALDKWGTDLWKIVRIRRGWQEKGE